MGYGKDDAVNGRFHDRRNRVHEKVPVKNIRRAVPDDMWATVEKVYDSDSSK